MYFNNQKQNTNINDEFDKNKKNLSYIISFISKYKKIIITSAVIISLLVLISLIFAKRKVDNYLTLNGEEVVTIYEGTDYIEPGYKAYNSKNEDLTNQVNINSNLNNNAVGEYEILYTLNGISKVRKIKVIEKQKEYTYIYLKSVDDSTTVYLNLGQDYKEPGYMVFSTTGEDLTSKVQVTGTIDTSKKGTYELVYSLVDSNNVTITKVRKIVVMSSEINLSLSKSEYTNKNIKIKVSINDEYFDYLILPDNGKITQNPYEYEVSENGKYTFKVYNNKGMLTESSIEVTNIDKILPTGSCQGKYKDGISTITVTANDNIGINNYEYNGKIYNSKTITINSEIKKANIKIYDKSGNEKIISCNLENKNDIIFNKNITYSYEYVYKANGVSYALYTPSTASTNETVPLIIWLHGSGSRGISKKDFRDNGLIGIVDDWTLDNFNAYILCPHISKETTSSWGSGNIKEKFYVIFEEILQNKNIDKNKIVLSGHSMGGIGVYDVANGKSDYFSAFTVMSGYNTRTDLSQYQNKPIKGYVGTPEKGEDESSYKHMTKTFINKFGQENLNILEVSHGALPKKAFNIDKNNDNKSDLIEWMLNQKK